MNYFVCIFCGYHSKELLDFRVTTTSGLYSRKTFGCPSCKQTMRERTIKSKFNAREWARYIYLCIRCYKEKDKEYFHRISFDKLKRNLKILGVAGEFWEEWKQVKEDAKEKTSDELFRMLFEIVEHKEIKPKKTTMDAFINPKVKT